MPALMNNYTSDMPSRPYPCEYVSIWHIRTEEFPRRIDSILFKDDSNKASALNARAFANLEAIIKLRDNWDGDDTPAPSAEVIRRARALTANLETASQRIFNIAPGPRGEIMIDVRGQHNKSVEFIIYPDKDRFVKFSDTEAPEQGLFDASSISKLLIWVNK